MRAAYAFILVGLLVFGCTAPSEGRQPAQPQEPSQPDISVIPAAVEPAEPEAPETLPGEEEPVLFPPSDVPPPVTSDKAKLVEWYVMNKMMGPDGQVRHDSDSYSFRSESVWMVMEYALKTNNRTLFDKEFEFLKGKQLDSTHNLAYAELDAGLEPVKSGGYYHSATGADLRIVRALYGAHDKWGGSDYAPVAKKMRDSILANEVFGQVMVREAFWSGGSITPSTLLRTDDPDWHIIQKFGEEKQEWKGVMERTRSHVLGCRESGMFWPIYDAAALGCKYEPGAGVAQTRVFLTAAISFVDIQAMEPGVVTMNKMNNEYSRYGILSNAYAIPFNGVPNGEEDPGTYAVMGRLAAKMGSCTIAANMRDEVLRYFVGDADSPLYGSISYNGTAMAYDNLQALLFFEEYEDYC